MVAPSALAHSERLPDPLELSLSDIEDLKEKWVATVKRAVWAGFDVVEIHNAHGYLLHEFLSPVSNKRTDKYGGSWENRARLTMEIVELTRKNIPESMPLFLRLSATDWLEEEMPDEPSWRVEDSVRLAKMLVGKVDLLDVSSGGNSPKQHIHAGPVQIPGVDGKSTAYQAVSIVTDGNDEETDVILAFRKNGQGGRRGLAVGWYCGWNSRREDGAVVDGDRS